MPVADPVFADAAIRLHVSLHTRGMQYMYLCHPTRVPELEHEICCQFGDGKIDGDDAAVLISELHAQVARHAAGLGGAL